MYHTSLYANFLITFEYCYFFYINELLIFIIQCAGTGKTILLVQMGLEWRHEHKDVHVVSCEGEQSLAANVLVHHQLHELAGHLPGNAVFHHIGYGEREKLLKELEACASASGGSLYIVADECTE